MNDLSNVVGNYIYQYADDTVLVSCATNYSDAISSLQNEATKAMDWFAANLISINPSKTRLVCFHNPMKKSCLRHHYSCTHQTVLDVHVNLLKMHLLLSILGCFLTVIFYGTRNYPTSVKGCARSPVYYTICDVLCQSPFEKLLCML